MRVSAVDSLAAGTCYILRTLHFDRTFVEERVGRRAHSVDLEVGTSPAGRIPGGRLEACQACRNVEDPCVAVPDAPFVVAVAAYHRPEVLGREPVRHLVGHQAERPMIALGQTRGACWVGLLPGERCR